MHIPSTASVKADASCVLHIPSTAEFQSQCFLCLQNQGSSGDPQEGMSNDREVKGGRQQGAVGAVLDAGISREALGG